MNKEELIKKWLDNELNISESKAFEALEEHDELVKMSNALKQFKAPEFNSDDALDNVLGKINSSTSRNSNSTNWIKPLMRIAAIFVLAFSVYYYTTTLDTNIITLASEKTSIKLPDNSEVTLNALSTLHFNKNSWKKERSVDLDGEAYFIVAKGSKFDVNTSSGIVSVLGTQFNVKHRDKLFEVTCFEGAVKVEHNSKTTVLKPGDSFLLLDGKIIAKEKEINLNPSWLNNESYFKSMPFNYVVNEFERQYNVTINTQSINDTQLFTGSFTHSDIDLALKAITLPFNLKYSINKNTIVLERE